MQIQKTEKTRKTKKLYEIRKPKNQKTKKKLVKLRKPKKQNTKKPGTLRFQKSIFCETLGFLDFWFFGLPTLGTRN